MKFRHNLAKETFKGKKKNTERGVEDLIDPDQRGNQSSAEVETNILSLDKETITPEPVAEEPREMSRRDIFSFGNFLDFGTAVEDEAQKSAEKIPQKQLEDEKDEKPEVSAESEPVEGVEEVEKIEESEPKKGFFKRLISKFKSDPEEKLSLQSEPETQPESAEGPVEESIETSAELGNNIFEIEEAEDPEYDRRNLLRQGVHFFAKPAVDITDTVFAVGPTGETKVRIIRPAGNTDRLPVIVYFHGAGWGMGDTGTHDRLVRELAVRANAALVFVDYERSPEVRYPYAIEQDYAVTKYVAEHGEQLNIDPTRLAIAGDSVGGNMTAVVSLLAEERGGPEITTQVLFYPVTDADFGNANTVHIQDSALTAITRLDALLNR